MSICPSARESLIPSWAQFGDGMKLKITITGPNVHKVGYGPFLIALADEFAIQKFEVHNSVVEGRQVVIAKT